MSITELGNLAQWLEVTQSVVAIIGLPILTLTLLMIGRQAQYAHHTTMSQVYQNTADGFATVQRYFIVIRRAILTPYPEVNFASRLTAMLYRIVARYTSLPSKRPEPRPCE